MSVRDHSDQSEGAGQRHARAKVREVAMRRDVLLLVSRGRVAPAGLRAAPRIDVGRSALAGTSPDILTYGGI